MSDASNATPRWANTRIAARLGIQYPIIQGPLGGLSSRRLTAAVSISDGLGSFGAHGLTPSAITDLVAELRLMSNQDKTTAWANTRIATKLGIKYPIIQGPFGGLSSQRLTATELMEALVSDVSAMINDTFAARRKDAAE